MVIVLIPDASSQIIEIAKEHALHLLCHKLQYRKHNLYSFFLIDNAHNIVVYSGSLLPKTIQIFQCSNLLFSLSGIEYIQSNTDYYIVIK